VIVVNGISRGGTNILSPLPALAGPLIDRRLYNFKLKNFGEGENIILREHHPQRLRHLRKLDAARHHHHYRQYAQRMIDYSENRRAIQRGERRARGES